MSKLVQIGRRVTLGAFAVAVVVVLAACSAAAPADVDTASSTSADEFSEVEMRAVPANKYGVRLGEVAEGSKPGTATAELFLPSDPRGGGVYFKVVSIEANSPFPQTLCEGAVLVSGETRLDGGSSCGFSVSMKGGLREGVFLQLQDVPADAASYELEVRPLGDGTAWKPELRAVFMIGKLLP